MSVREELQGGRMEGGGREEEDDHDGCSKRVRDEEQVERQAVCAKKRRIRSENWSARETLQMLQLRKAIVDSSIAKGSDAWKQIAQQLAAMNLESQARSSKQVAQRWDTLVKIYVSVGEHCCETGKSSGEVIDERQKRCKTEYRQLWHELIAQGNPGKRRTGKTAVQPDEALASSANGAPQAVTTTVRKFGEIAKSFTEMLDTIGRSISSSEETNEALGQADKHIVTGCNWELEDDQGLETTISASGLKERKDETKAEVARATQSMFDTMQSISKAASTSGSFCLEVDQKDWSVVMQRLSAISQKYQELSRHDIREEVGADVWVPNTEQQTNSAGRSSHDYNQRTLSLTSSLHTKICKRTEKSSSSGKCNGGSTESSTFAGLPAIVPLSPKSMWTSRSESFCPEVDQKDWSMVIQRLSAISQGFQAISFHGIRDEVGADECNPNSQQQTVSAARSTHDHTNNSIQRSLSLTSSFYISGKICKKTSLSCSSGTRDGGSTASPATSTATFAGLPDIVQLSPKSDCESLSGSRWLEADQTNSPRRNTCATSSMEKVEKLEEKKEKKKRTESRTSILKFRQRLALEEVGEKGSRSMTRTMSRFGPRVQGLEEQKH